MQGSHRGLLGDTVCSQLKSRSTGLHSPAAPAIREATSSPGSPSGTWLGMGQQPLCLPYPTWLLSFTESFPAFPMLWGYFHSPPGTSGIERTGVWRRPRPEVPTRSSISSGANTTQEITAKSQPGVGWEQTTISLPRKTNWTCQEERNSSTSHTYGLILMDMYEHKGRRITFWLG